MFYFLFIHKRNPQQSVANCLPLDWSEIKWHHYGDGRRRKNVLKPFCFYSDNYLLTDMVQHLSILDIGKTFNIVCLFLIQYHINKNVGI
jgi:hypothetical protein